MDRHELPIEGAHATSATTLTGNDADPFAEALIASLPGLRRYATALAGNVAAADDLVQDCIERALRRSETLRDTRRMGGWLRSILHNVHIDEVRRRRARIVGVDFTEMDNDLALSVPPDDQSANIDFMRAFDGLSREHKQILLLSGLEGLNYREIGVELGIPIGTVMSRLARARERLRNTLEERSFLAPNAQLESMRSAKR